MYTGHLTSIRQCLAMSSPNGLFLAAVVHRDGKTRKITYDLTLLYTRQPLCCHSRYKLNHFAFRKCYSRVSMFSDYFIVCTIEYYKHIFNYEMLFLQRSNIPEHPICLYSKSFQFVFCVFFVSPLVFGTTPSLKKVLVEGSSIILTSQSVSMSINGKDFNVRPFLFYEEKTFRFGVRKLSKYSHE